MQSLPTTKLRKRSITILDPVSKTQQLHMGLCDIDNIVETYRKTGHLPALRKVHPTFADNSTVPSFEETHDAVIQAKEAYNRLPKQIRNETNHDYKQFQTWLENPANIQTAEKYGLVHVNRKKTTPVAPQEPKKGAADPPQAN